MIVQKLREKLRKRIKTPTVLQMEAVECGAAALAIVMGHYGRIVPLEELRIACGVSRNGSKASNILRAARKYNFQANGYKRSLRLVLKGPFPAIIFWNFNHFVVLEGFSGDKVYLNDPAVGPRTVTMDEFDESFTGVIILIEPGPEFKRGGKKPKLGQALRKRLIGSGTSLILILFASLMLTILGLIVPSYTRIFIDHYLVAGLTTLIPYLLLAMGGTVAMMIGIGWLQQHYLLRLETKLAITMSSRFVWHILRLPIDFFYQRHTADISVRININDRIARLLSGELATNLLNIILILFYVVVMIQYDLLLTGVGVLMALLNIVTLRIVSRWRVDANQRLLNEQGKFTSTAYSGLQMIETLKASGSEGDFFARWAGHQAKTINAGQALGLSTELLAAVPAILSTINIAIILMIGGLRITTGNLSIGELIAFQALVTSFLMPVTQLVNLGSRLQQTEGDMVRIDDVLRYPIDERTVEEETAVSSAIATTKLSGQLTLDNITFGYSQLETPLVDKFNLALKPGARVALVGSSGSGKSTVARLVAGVHELWDGEIRFDERPRDQVSLTQLKNSIAMIDQEIYLFSGTVRQNITMWDETIPETQIIQAAKDAAIHNDIAARAGGYDYQVNEGGGNFSGGQRQRLEIARALSRNPTILIMDEATSALDPITEKMIDDNLRRRGCTCLIVAHRLSTIRDCDEIIVMEKGKVVQRGTHREMIHIDGPYSRLIKADQSIRSEASAVLDLL